MAKTSPAAVWQRYQTLQAVTIITAVVVGLLYWAQVVFIPLALAGFLTFLLSPLVTALERRGLGRVVSVVLVGGLAALALAAVLAAVGHQLTRLTAELPGHLPTIQHKVQGLRERAAQLAGDKLPQFLEEVGGGPKPAPPANAPPDAAPPADGKRPPGEPPAQVVVQQNSPGWLAQLSARLGTLLEPAGSVALAVVLAIFMLLKREDLRNRLLRLAGRGRMTVTTRAVDEAGRRISRFLLMQLIVNGSYGLTLAVGLLLVGVDYALLWGFLAAVLRYVPYLGAWVAALPPVALTLIQFEGWAPFFLVAGGIVVLELVSNNVMEPWLFGQSMGVSPLAQLVAAAFWAFLWGPLGLVLSGPLTVCLAVLGKYIPQLEVFDVLLGDQPALAPDVTFYQRLLARDQDEASRVVQAFVKEHSVEAAYDAMLVPALIFARRDREQGELSEADEQFIFRALEETVAELGEPHAAAAARAADAAGGTLPRVRILGCPAQDEADRLALVMLRQLLDPARWDMEVAGTDMLASEMLPRAQQQGVGVLCLGALPPGGLAHTRYLCKRLGGRLPGARFVVGRWGLKEELEQNLAELKEACAEHVGTTLQETREQLTALLPALAAGPAAPPRDAGPALR